MPHRHRAAYPLEFRQKLIDLARAGRTPKQLAKEFEPSEVTISAWIKQADLNAGRRNDGITSAEREELARLRRENKQLRVERDIL
jgi:transposase